MTTLPKESKTKSGFLSLMKKNIILGESFSLAKLPALLKAADKSFSPEQYGHTKLLDLVKEFPQDILVVVKDGYNPPVHSITVLDHDSDSYDQEGRELLTPPPAEIHIPSPAPVLRTGITVVSRQSEAPAVPFKDDLYTYVGMESLFGGYAAQPKGSYFSKVYFDEPGNYNMVYKRLSDLASNEDWGNSTGEFAVLKNYLKFTFLRVLVQDKIVYSEDGCRACFNTGLRTPAGKDIYISFKKNHAAEKTNDTQWIYDDLFDSYSTGLRAFTAVPPIATYIEDPSALVFDYRFDFEVNVDHIISDNKDRLLPEFSDSPKLATFAMEGALRELKETIKRNYRVVVPFWYNGGIQLLVPFDAKGDGKPSMVFVLEKDARMQIYRVKTLLSREMAYNNARLLRKMDADWII